MKIRHLPLLLCLLPVTAYSEIYKAVDKEGHVTYSSAPIKGGKKIVLEPLPTMPPPAHARSPQDFPRVDGQTQKGRDETRRKILQDELNSEEQAMTEARKKLTELEEENRGYAVVQGKTVFNEARNIEYLKILQDQKEQVESHQRNIEALKTELSKLP